jgi:histidinol dehydrogenase
MSTLNLRRIRCADSDALRQLSELRRRLSLQADVVSERGRQLTVAVFGQALTPAQVVERVCADVRERGLQALLHYTEQFDRARLDARSVRVSEDELAEAHAAADPVFLDAVRRVRHNVLSFQAGLLHSDASCACATGPCAASASASPAGPPPTPRPC